MCRYLKIHLRTIYNPIIISSSLSKDGGRRKLVGPVLSVSRHAQEHRDDHTGHVLLRSGKDPLPVSISPLTNVNTKRKPSEEGYH